MFWVMRYESFYSVWYWVLVTLIWTVACYQTMGVPYGMILRAARLPEVAREVDAVAMVAARRMAWLGRRLGVPLAAIAGFGLASLAVLGFGSGSELAQALFMLLFPLSLVGAATLALGRDMVATGARGDDLRRMLARRRMWNQVIAILAMLATALVALLHNPNSMLY